VLNLNTALPAHISPANIAIIGAGLLGRLIAVILNEQGHNVTLFDKDDKAGKNSAAYAAAGLLTPLGEAVQSEANIVEMGFISLKLWPKILAKLSGFTFFQQQGAIVVSHEHDRSDYQKYVRYLSSYYPQHKTKQLNRVQLQALEPELSRSFHQGLYLPDEGQIGNRKLLSALRQTLEAAKIAWHTLCDVTSIIHKPDSVSVNYKKEQTQYIENYDFAIDTRGCGARTSVTNTLGLATLRAVRGELFQLYAPNVSITRPIRLMHPRYQLYIAPKPKGHYVIGATEIESDDLSPMTVRSSMELLSAAYSIHPGFAEANIRQHISQLRPAFSDNQPQIRVSKRLLQINGLYRHGYLIAPVIVEQAHFAINQQLARLNNIPNNAMNQSPYHSLIAISETTT